MVLGCQNKILLYLKKYRFWIIIKFMKRNYKKFCIMAIFLLNILFLFIFFFGSCDYFKQLSRKEWEEKNGIYPYVYLYGISGNTIKAFKIDYNSNGILDWKYSQNIIFGLANTTASNISVKPDNNILYINGSYAGPNEVTGYYINKDGSLSQLPSFPQVIKYDQFTYDMNSEIVYAKGYDRSIRMYGIDKASGLLSNLYDFSFGNVCIDYGFIADKTGKYLYDLHLNTTSQYNFKVLKINNGKISDNGGISNCGFVNYTNGFDIEPSGNYLYLADYTNNIRGYNLNNGTLLSVPGSPYPVGAGYNVLKTASDGKYLFSSGSSNLLKSYKINSNDGSITNIYSLGCNNGPSKIIFDPFSKYAYVRSDNGAGSSVIHIFRINDDGTFYEVFGSPVSAGSITDIAIVQK
jgi:6-phosphogluconolactonase (cycloisomerase 2 family)